MWGGEGYAGFPEIVRDIGDLCKDLHKFVYTVQHGKMVTKHQANSIYSDTHIT